jgi:hypothetical protein
LNKIKFLYFLRIIGFSNEQFDRVANSIILLLSHIDADYRLIAATNLANLNKETKPIDIALLNSFINDPRVCFIYLFFFVFSNYIL